MNMERGLATMAIAALALISLAACGSDNRARRGNAR